MVGWEDDRMTLQYFLHNGKLPGGQSVRPSPGSHYRSICCIMAWTGQGRAGQGRLRDNKSYIHQDLQAQITGTLAQSWKISKVKYLRLERSLTEKANKGWHLRPQRVSRDHLFYSVYSSQIENICHHPVQSFHFTPTSTQYNKLHRMIFVAVKYFHIYNLNYFQARWEVITILTLLRLPASALLTWRQWPPPLNSLVR